MKAFQIDEAGWYVLAQDRQELQRVFNRNSSVSIARNNRLHCDGCQHSFSRPFRHSCSNVMPQYVAGSLNVLASRSQCHEHFKGLKMQQGTGVLEKGDCNDY